jgi:O-antigen ligase/polysaccharide polymerase Wzy-like membrane protein
MRPLLGVLHRDWALIAAAGALAALSFGVPSAREVTVLALSLAVLAILAVARSLTVGWDRLIALILVVVLFVPIGRYRLPGSLPFNLELYRVVVALCILVWTASLLVDSRVRLKSTPFDRPLALIVACVLASEITNPTRVSAYGSHVIKSLTFFLSFVLVYYLTATTLQRRSSVEMLLKLFTVSGAAIGVLAVVELRTHYNVFDHLHALFPFLQFQGTLGYLMLGSNLRVFGPAQQPIALGAALILIFPLAVYCGRRFGRLWWVAALLILLGALASGSRTAIVMLSAEAIIFLILKPNETKKLWPALIPALAVVHFALPGTIGGLKNAFFPKGGLIAQQSKFEADYNPLLAGGRVRLLKPMLRQASAKPLFGEGYGTRISGFDQPDRNAPILDDQWLNNALDVGFIGLAAWGWLMARAVRRLVRASRTSAEVGDDWLFAALAASVTSFAVGMFVFDAFSFTQATFIFWILLGLSGALLIISGAESVSPASAPLYSRPRWARSGGAW